MAIGDNANMLARLRGLLPKDWFGSSAPVLNAVLTGSAAAFAYVYSFFQYAKLQTRLNTMTGAFLDLLSQDFFGFAGFQRGNGEQDATYRARIKKEMFRERQTRKGLSVALSDLTGSAPDIIEPWNPGDCGGYDYAQSCGYDVAGFLGDPGLKYTVFIRAYDPYGQGVPTVSGYDNIGGYDAGYMEYIDPAQIQGPVTAPQVYQLVDRTRAAGITAWVQVNTGAKTQPVIPSYLAPYLATDAGVAILTDDGMQIGI